MDQVDAVAHPLVWNSAGKLLVQPELKIKLRIEGTIRLVHQPGAPVRVLLADLLYFRTSAPTWPMIVPGDFVFADVSQGATADEIAYRDLVRLAAVLRANLHDQILGLHGIARGLGFLENISHGLFAVAVFARIGDHLKQWGVGMLGRRDDDGVDIFQADEFFRVVARPRRL